MEKKKKKVCGITVWHREEIHRWLSPKEFLENGWQNKGELPTVGILVMGKAGTNSAGSGPVGPFSTVCSSYHDY